ncbi:MAG: discoidin domain-containing protein [Phycisphaerales bacterium]|nr:MAG: discoidin domain-containing protein [Phycisphaerales bacterium]
MKRAMTLLGVVYLLMAASTTQAVLMIDFSQTGGAVEAGYEAYTAGHEAAATFTPQEFVAFGTTITITPTWASDATAQCMQMISRTVGDSRNGYTGDHPDLINDWIGTDNRQPGNPMTLTISGLPKGRYDWLSYHHDTYDQTGIFDVTINDATGSTTIIDVDISHSEPDTDGRVDGFENVTVLAATLVSNGTDDITLVFNLTSGSSPINNAFFLMNGFELEQKPTEYKATRPSPADSERDVLRDDSVLSWLPGEFAAAHDVYLGTSFDDVDNASVTSDPAGVYMGRQDEASYPLGRLQRDLTYYWRIDEVEADGTTVHKGDVWSFTVEPAGVPLAAENITASASSRDNVDEGPEKTIDGSGLDVNDMHSTEETSMWQSEMGGPQPTWIQYAFDQVYKLHQLRVWNHNSQWEVGAGYGFQDVTIEHSTDGVKWTKLPGPVRFKQATGQADYEYNTVVDLSGVAARHVKLTADTNWGGFIEQYGLSEVRFLYIPAWAREPSPASGATDMDVDNVTLRWLSGAEAASHEVYLGTDRRAVIDETISPVSVPAGGSYASYDTGELGLDQIYFWKVNEVNQAETPATWQGDLWNFSTEEYVTVDDFETYDDDYENYNRVFQVWIDGGGYTQPEPGHPGNGSGALIGSDAPPWVEQTIVHDGQSMPFSYNNSTSTYSEAAASVADLPIGQDWTKYGAKTLTLWFYGDPENAAEQMYAKLDGAKVPYDGDATDLQQAAWQEWNIDLTDFAGVDLRTVTEFAIGFERSGPIGGSGIVHFDDIRLYQRRCILSNRTADLAKADYAPTGYISGDCMVDHRELEIMMGDWLAEDDVVPTADPGPMGYSDAYYPFEEGTDTATGDESGNGRNGTFEGGVTWVAPGLMGDGAINVDGTAGSRVTIGNWDPAWADQLTVSIWVRWSGVRHGSSQGLISKRDGWSETALMFMFEIDTSGVESGLGLRQFSAADTDVISEPGAMTPFIGNWVHAAATFDGTTGRVYLDGREIASGPFALGEGTGAGVVIGNTNSSIWADSPEAFNGDLDEARIYDRALSPAQIAHLADLTPGDGQLHIPVRSPSELYDAETPGSRRVDFKDFAVLADQWLDEQLWPAQ